MAIKPILVVGGGISGITAAVEAAGAGRDVILVEKLPYLGGNVARMYNYFPKLCPPSCGLEINFRRIRQNRRIRIYTETVVKEFSGKAGNFRISLERAPQYITDNCTACGNCSGVCPVSRPDDFNSGFVDTKAAYLPCDIAFPAKYSIDGSSCLKKACNKCLPVCSYNAINLDATPEQINIEASAVIVATGWTGYDPSGISQLGYGRDTNIITNIQFERLLSLYKKGPDRIIRPSDGKPVKKVVFVQCAGSRDENHLPYCSAVCCSASLKHAINLLEISSGSHATIFYIDLRVTGRNEDFLRRAEENPGIDLVKGKVAHIETDPITGELVVEAEDILAGKKVKHRADLVVLATGIVPNDSGIPVQKRKDRFAYRDQAAGIHVVSCAASPMDVSAAVKDATGGVLKALPF